MINNIKIELLSDFSKAPEFADVAWLSMGKNPGPVSEHFLRDVHYYISNAKSKKPVINKTDGLACTLNNNGNIIGTICINADSRYNDFAQFSYLSILPSNLGRIHGKNLLRHACEIVKQCSDLEYIFGSTLNAGSYYEAIGIKQVGKMTADGYTRYFYGTEISKTL